MGDEENEGEGSFDEAYEGSLNFFTEEKEDLDEDYKAELQQKQEELQEEFKSFKKLVNLTNLYEPRPTERVLLKLNPLVAKICK